MSELQRALADEIRAEMSRQRITARDMQRRTDTKPASWGNYFVSVKREVPFPVIDAVCRELGVPASEMIRRAEAAHARLDPIEAELLEGLTERSRAVVDRERGADSVDPPKRASEGVRRAG